MIGSNSSSPLHIETEESPESIKEDSSSPRPSHDDEFEEDNDPEDDGQSPIRTHKKRFHKVSHHFKRYKRWYLFSIISLLIAGIVIAFCAVAKVGVFAPKKGPS